MYIFYNLIDYWLTKSPDIVNEVLSVILTLTISPISSFGAFT